jgi:hypothetical protein
MMQRRWRSWLASSLVAAGLSGCMTTKPCEMEMSPEYAEACVLLPGACRDHVYIFLVQGLDLVDSCHLKELRTHLHDLGFKKTYYAQLCHAGAIDKEIRRIHGCDPDAHFALIGYGCGANLVHDLTQGLSGCGIGIDLLVFLGSATVPEQAGEGACHAHRVINITGGCSVYGGIELAGATNIMEADIRNRGTPTHCQTLCLLAHELTAIAATVPYIERVEEPKTDIIEEAPTPRPVQPQVSRQRDEWDFLKPVSRLKSPRRPEPPPAPAPNAVKPEQVVRR